MPNPAIPTNLYRVRLWNEDDRRGWTLAEILNLKRLNESTGGDLDFGAELLEDFSDLLCEELGKLVHSAESGNLTDIRYFAHAIKGASASVGAEAVSECSGKVEDFAKAEDMKSVREALIELEKHAAGFLGWFESRERAA